MKWTLFAVSLLLGSWFAASAMPAGAVMEYIASSTVAGEPSEIGHHARWDLGCEALEPPRMTIERAPVHGSVCLAQGPVNVVVSRSRVGTSCIGKIVKGVHVIYSPGTNFTGTDTMRYGLDVPEGHVSLEVSIVIKPSKTTSSPVAANPEAQPAGPMPECAPLAS